LPWFIIATPSVFSRSASPEIFFASPPLLATAVRERNSGEHKTATKNTKALATKSHWRIPFLMDSIEESSFWTRDLKKPQSS
jgi:hypothetical protein